MEVRDGFTERLGLVIDDTSGLVTSVRSERTGHEYLREAGAIWSLSMPIRGRLSGLFCDPFGSRVDAAAQTPTRVRKIESDAGFPGAVVEYANVSSDDGVLPVSVEYTTVARDDDSVEIKCTVRNDSVHVIEEVLAPVLNSVRPSGDFQDAELVYPCDRWRLRDLLPIKENGNWEDHPYLRAGASHGAPIWPSISELSMPWVDIASNGEGLFLASMARSGSRHTLLVRETASGANALDLGWSFAPYLAQGDAWESPSIILVIHDGDWHAAADFYRRSLGQWYDRRGPARSRFWQAAASFNTCVTSRDFRQIAAVASDASTYRVEDLVTWYFGDYYPMLADSDVLTVDPPRLGQLTDQYGGEQALKDAVSRAGQTGVHVGTIVSQRLWNIDALSEDLRADAEEWVIRTMAGHPVREHWSHRHYGAAQWAGYHAGELYVMCTACEAWQELALSNIESLLRKSGYRTLFYDQATEQELCFAQRHQHQEPSAAQAASAGFLRRLRDLVHDVAEEGALIGEGVELLTSQLMDLNWVWVDRGWRHGSAARYRNPEVARYTLPWARIAFAAAMDRASLNELFVLGIHLALVPGSLESGKRLSEFPEEALHIRQLSTLLSTVTRRFGSLGDARYLDDVGIVSDDAFARAYWQNGKVCLLVANTHPEASAVRVLLEDEYYPVREDDAANIDVISNCAVSNGPKGIKSPAGTEVTDTLGGYEVKAYLIVASLSSH